MKNSPDNHPEQKWNRAEILALVSLAVSLSALIASLIVPEIRQFFLLESKTSRPLDGSGLLTVTPITFIKNIVLNTTKVAVALRVARVLFGGALGVKSENSFLQNFLIGAKEIGAIALLIFGVALANLAFPSLFGGILSSLLQASGMKITHEEVVIIMKGIMLPLFCILLIAAIWSDEFISDFLAGKL